MVTLSPVGIDALLIDHDTFSVDIEVQYEGVFREDDCDDSMDDDSSSGLMSSSCSTSDDPECMSAGHETILRTPFG